MIFDVAKDVRSPKHDSTWCELLKKRLGNLSGRSAPSWSIGMIEAHAVVEVDFSAGPRIVTPEAVVGEMFDALAAEVRKRNPLLGEGMVAP